MTGLERLPREGVLYELPADFTVEQRIAMRTRIHRDHCACQGVIETCEALLEGAQRATETRTRARTAVVEDAPVPGSLLDDGSIGVGTAASVVSGRGNTRTSVTPTTTRGGAAAARRVAAHA